MPEQSISSVKQYCEEVDLSSSTTVAKLVGGVLAGHPFLTSVFSRQLYANDQLSEQDRYYVLAEIFKAELFSQEYYRLTASLLNCTNLDVATVAQNVSAEKLIEILKALDFLKYAKNSFHCVYNTVELLSIVFSKNVIDQSTSSFRELSFKAIYFFARVTFETYHYNVYSLCNSTLDWQNPSFDLEKVKFQYTCAVFKIKAIYAKLKELGQNFAGNSEFCTERLKDAKAFMVDCPEYQVFSQEVVDIFNTPFIRSWFHFALKHNPKLERACQSLLDKKADKLDDAWEVEFYEFTTFCNPELGPDKIDLFYSKRAFKNQSAETWLYFENVSDISLITRIWTKGAATANQVLMFSPELFFILYDNLVKTGYTLFKHGMFMPAGINTLLSVRLDITKTMFQAGVELFNSNCDTLFEELLEFNKIVYFDRLIEAACQLKPLNVQEVIAKSKEVKGWVDAIRSVDNRSKWLILAAKEMGKSPFYTLFYQQYPTYNDSEDLNDTLDVYEQSTLEALSYEDKWAMLHAFNTEFDPYDGRGGFSLNTFKKIVAYNVTPESRHRLHSEGGSKWWGATYAFVQAATKLAYLYGPDFEAAKAAIDAKQKELACSFDVAIHDLGQIPIKAVAVDTIKAWRPFLIKYSSLLSYCGRLDGSPLPDKGDTVEALKNKLCSSAFLNVPTSLLPHMAHAIENGWDQEIMDEFIELSKTKRKEHWITKKSINSHDYSVRVLEPHDLTALYIGELSGCCQHINEGAGNDAAIQSYTEPWCGVVVVESAGSKKLLAQSFVWLTKDLSAIVLDSIESIFENGDSILESTIFPALLEWAQELLNSKEYSHVYIGDTDYGITSEFCQFITENTPKHLKISQEKPKPYKRLEYSDIEEECLTLSLITNA